MIAIDTNVLIRVLVNDPGAPQQVKRARQLVSEAKRVFVSQPVQIETLWVLSYSYGFDKKASLRVLDEMQCNEAFELQHDDIFVAALESYRATNIDFSDAVILSISRAHALTVFSFDKKMARQPGAHLVSQGLAQQ